MEKFTDGHCHFELETMYESLDRAKKHIDTLMAIVDIADNNYEEVMEKLKEYKHIKIFIALGCHPNSVEKLDFQEMKNRYEKYVTKIDCIGEVGLDFFRSTNIEEQKKYLRYQSQLAIKYNKPLNIHARGCSMDELLEIIKYNSNITIHCCTFSWADVQKALKLGAYISYSGIITFKKKAELIQESAFKTPLDHLLIETDSPYLAPVPLRGKPNECMFIKHSYDFLSQQRNISLSHLKEIINKNFYKSINQERVI